MNKKIIPLLIIFVVVVGIASFIKSAKVENHSSSQETSSQHQQSDQTIIVIDQNGIITIRGEIVQVSDFPEKIKTKSVLIQTSKSTSYESIKPIMTQLGEMLILNIEMTQY